MAEKSKAASRKNGSKTGERRGPPPPPEETRFKPGNPGRPKGSRNKLGEAFLTAMHADFEEHGVAAIQQVRAEKPDAYLKVIASILPRDLNLTVNRTDEMSDAELVERIRSLDAAIRPFLDAEGESRAGRGAGSATAH